MGSFFGKRFHWIKLSSSNLCSLLTQTLLQKIIQAALVN